MLVTTLMMLVGLVVVIAVAIVAGHFDLRSRMRRLK
jgi:cyanophycinase-like exopeptidase